MFFIRVYTVAMRKCLPSIYIPIGPNDSVLLRFTSASKKLFIFYMYLFTHVAIRFV